MPLEAATYIHQLEISNPAPTDQLRQADDHIRLIKAAIKATFPNVEGVVEASQDDLNALFAEPIGIIKLWYGSEADCPSGYAVCKGQTLARSDGAGNITLPDMRGRVAMGVADSAGWPLGHTLGAIIGTTSTDSQGAHTHSAPAHTHTFEASTTSGNAGGSLNVTTGNIDDGYGAGAAVVTAVSGGTGVHNHSVSVSGVTASTAGGATDSQGAHTHSVSYSPYQPTLALHYIMKV